VGVPLVEEEGWRLDLDAFRNGDQPEDPGHRVVNPRQPHGHTVFKELGADGSWRALALEHDLYLVTDDPYEVLHVRQPEEVLPALHPGCAPTGVISCSSSPPRSSP